LSAEGRFSALILFALPLVIGGVLFKMNPDYMLTLFTDPMGQNMLMVGSFLMVIGAIVMKRMVAIKV
jgi:tight adherence protein B